LFWKPTILLVNCFLFFSQGIEVYNLNPVKMSTMPAKTAGTPSLAAPVFSASLIGGKGGLNEGM
jgi:hypothetical protein